MIIEGAVNGWGVIIRECVVNWWAWSMGGCSQWGVLIEMDMVNGSVISGVGVAITVWSVKVWSLRVSVDNGGVVSGFG